jgi:hypothetical protein
LNANSENRWIGLFFKLINRDYITT